MIVEIALILHLALEEYGSESVGKPNSCCFFHYFPLLLTLEQHFFESVAPSQSQLTEKQVYDRKLVNYRYQNHSSDVKPGFLLHNEVDK